MPPRPARSESVKRNGTIAAIALGAGCLVAVGFFVVRSVVSGGPEPEAGPEASGIVIRPGTELTPGTPVGGDNIRIKLVDKSDPTRRAGVLVLKSMDPLEGHQYAVAGPDAWIYLKDGGAVHITADRGRLYMPDAQSQPESGSLSGNVAADFYDKRADGKLPDGSEPPQQTFRTASLFFDGALGEMMTQDPFTIHRPRAFRVRSTGLKVIVNEAREKLESFATATGGTVEFWQQEQKAREAKTKPAPQPERTASGAQPAAPAAPPKPTPAPIETAYIMTFPEAVQVNAAPRTLHADQLQLWARLIDNKLPENAIAQIKFKQRKADTHRAEPQAEPALPTQTATTTASTLQDSILHAPHSTLSPETPPTLPTSEPSPDFTLAWSGPCTVLPLDPKVAPELKHDHVAMRLSAAAPRGVTFRDDEQGASGSGSAITYGLTTGQLTLIGDPTAAALAAATAARLESPKVGAILADHLGFSLATGIVHIPGRGTISAAEEGELSASWSKQADFEFLLDQGELTNILKQALFEGGVLAGNKSGTGSAEFIRGDFSPPRPGREQSDLSRLILERGARLASAGEDGSLEGDRVDVAFEPGTGDSPRPTMVTAIGSARAQRDQTSLACDFLEANLAQNPVGDTDVTSVRASKAVVYKNKKDGTSASGDELYADLSWAADVPVVDGSFERRQLVRLTGESAEIRKDSTTIGGKQMALDGVAKTLEVFGAGSLMHLAGQETDFQMVSAGWSEGMRYNDLAGTIECDGRVLAEVQLEPNSSDTLRSGRLRIWIGPPEQQLPSGSIALGDSNRPLLRAEAIGSIVDGPGGANASIERRHIEVLPHLSAPKVQELYYLEGPQILLNNTEQTLDVPAAGRLVLLDQRPEEPRPTAAEPENPLASTSSRGSALFDWDGSLHMDRASGEIDFRRNVRLTHSPLTSESQEPSITNLVSERLTAHIREIPAPAPAAGEPAGKASSKAELVSASATGAVYVTSGPEIRENQPKPPTTELIADSVEYDAARRTVTAAAAPGNTVMLFDPKQPSPVSAARLLWDLASDRIEIKQPGPVVMPRGRAVVR
jgi:hypothetical protein